MAVKREDISKSLILGGFFCFTSFTPLRGKEGRQEGPLLPRAPDSRKMMKATYTKITPLWVNYRVRACA